MIAATYMCFHICSIDRTYKFYYGGAQKRPDGQYSRPITGANGEVLAVVGEGNRKDVRNAVEAAHKAAPGYITHFSINFMALILNTIDHTSHVFFLRLLIVFFA